MKTKITYILILVFCLQVITSCKKGFLDKQPLDKPSSLTFWQSDNDVQAGLAGVYQSLQSELYNQHKPWLDTYSDNAYDRFSYFGFDVLTQGIVNPTNVNGNLYGVPYNGIARCNYFLDNVGKAPITDAARNAYSAEVRFIRAMYYFDLLQCFGGVVVYKTTPASADAAKIPQNSKADVIAFIESDLDFAIANLPDVAYSGHAVKGTALAEEARVALYQQDWQSAVTLTNQIITGGKFSLASDYKGLFLTATQQNNPEIMFSTKYLAPNNYQGENRGVDIELGWFGAVGPYQNLVDEYETTSGKMITDPTSGYSAANAYVNRDPRLKMTIKVPTDPFLNPDGTVFNNTDPLLTGFSTKKYVDLSRVPFNYTIANKTDQNIVHIRYAEVLLMYAEAKNELSGPDATIFQALNQIRARPTVNMPPVDQTKYGSQSTLRDFIRHERRVELALEGHRYYDLKRWNLMQSKLSQIKNPGGVTLSFGEKNNVLPFPQYEIDRNSQLKQNPGY